MKSFSAFALAAALLLTTSSLPAETWQLSSGDGLWGDPNSWSPASVPNAVGAAATFNSPTAARTITLGDGNTYTVGSMNITNNAAPTGFTSTIRNNSSNTRGAASLIFDATGAGPVVINVAGTGTQNNLITADMRFD